MIDECSAVKTIFCLTAVKETPGLESTRQHSSCLTARAVPSPQVAGEGTGVVVVVAARSVCEGHQAGRQAGWPLPYIPEYLY